MQLYAASLPIAIEAFDREQLSRAKRLEKTNEKRNLNTSREQQPHWTAFSPESEARGVGDEVTLKQA